MTTLGAPWRDGPVLVVSPHLDDAVLSAFALLSSGCAHVLTLFDGSPDPPVVTSWDRLCGFENSSEAVESRHAENAAAFDSTGIPHTSLGLLDSQYVVDRPAGDAERILQTVQDWASSQSASAVSVAVTAGAGRAVQSAAVGGRARSARRKAIRRAVGPLGHALLDARARFVAPRTPPSAHEDHQFARDALIRALPVLRLTAFLLYEELPYLWGAPADEAVAVLNRASAVDWEPFSLPVDRVEKARRIACYPSQLRYMYSPDGPLDRWESLPPQERYWLVHGFAGG